MKERSHALPPYSIWLNKCSRLRDHAARMADARLNPEIPPCSTFLALFHDFVFASPAFNGWTANLLTRIYHNGSAPHAASTIVVLRRTDSCRALRSSHGLSGNYPPTLARRSRSPVVFPDRGFWREQPIAPALRAFRPSTGLRLTPVGRRGTGIPACVLNRRSTSSGPPPGGPPRSRACASPVGSVCRASSRPCQSCARRCGSPASTRAATWAGAAG